VAENKNPTPAPSTSDDALWFCLKSQPKHEHIAAAHLRQNSAVGVFLPRIRFKRATRRGTVWVTEALFPGYLFARFDWQSTLRQVQHSRGVRGVVHFGERWPAIPDAVILELQQAVGATGLHTIPENLKPGDEVEITEGAMRGLRAVVTRVLPGRERIAVLMEFLGRQTMIELPRHFLIKEGDERAGIFTGGSAP
jgi:transcriptional antiterminator RfaH